MKTLEDDSPQTSSSPSSSASSSSTPSHKSDASDQGKSEEGRSDAGAGSGGGGDVGRLAAVLCFDEVQVTDVFGAVALKALFEVIMDAGCVVVSTSNKAPTELSPHGLHEDMFTHFVESILQRCDLLNLSSEHDYRRLMLVQPFTPQLSHTHHPSHALPRPQLPHTYFSPLDSTTHMQMERCWQLLTQHEQQHGARDIACDSTAPQIVQVMFGRQLTVPRACGGVCWFDFLELCGRPLGAPDYLALAASYHTIMISNVPALSMQVRDQARRFITLIDELYNARCVVVLGAAVPPDMLFGGGEGQGEEPLVDLEALMFETAVEGSRLRRNVMAEGGVAPVAASPSALVAAVHSLGGSEERFAFSRAVSRLYEMQSALYINVRAKAPSSGGNAGR